MLFDSHLHLDQLSDENIQKTLGDSKITGMLTVSTNLKSAKKLLNLKQAYPEKLYIAVGFHPEQPLLNLEEREELFQWIDEHHSSISAIGEVGLPYYSKRENLNLDYTPYIELLERFILIAKKWDLPLNLHIVHNDVDIALELLQKHNIQRAHFHWFKTDEKSFQKFLSTPYFASLTPDILWNPKTQYVAQHLSLNRLMIETDSPWPHEGLESAVISEQLFAVVKKVAELRSLPLHYVQEQMLLNTQQFYRL
ncbi:TatD family deoxyribonuclease [Haemophilus haemolyticus]|uniref:TatD family deoxyribonuclease n=1 Tax=Haemophilus haemolyticus TaxID=726 RepID=A0A502K680_HAEHA|nr:MULTISPECIES: TatD family hydrolase [Haemophilus]MBS6046237.1 TatD family hydrolase [Haemophilus haemolyticus]MBS6050395.1 TatD family hydrolase [Haemophilus haemolyticus]MDK7281376.1 TatD family hydrolase [Haemophilus seminalis]TPH01723.1 TatD family deoxyribonuclease [Haemophilus haemolyticus]TPH06005.1 TatD family deoxyribonuclease [Haemophilus haemolyticus]